MKVHVAIKHPTTSTTLWTLDSTKLEHLKLLAIDVAQAISDGSTLTILPVPEINTKP